MRLSVLALTLICFGCAPSAPPGSQPLSLFTHCGVYEVDFGGVRWTPASIDRGSSPDGVGFNATDGWARRVGDKLEFVADTGLEIIFEPAPDDLEPIPGCD